MKSPRSTMSTMALAGTIGGLAEIAWIVLYVSLTPMSAADVSREVVASVAPALAISAFAPVLGIAIHLALSLLLGLIAGMVLWQPLSRWLPPQAMLVLVALSLIVVWAINFLVVLPWLHPAFVTLLPYPVTFFSKLLFGLSAGAWLLRSQRKADTRRLIFARA